MSKGFAHSVLKAIHNANVTAKKGLAVLSDDISIIIYPLLAFILILVAIPALTTSILAVANWIADRSIFSEEYRTAKIVLVAVAGLLSALSVALILAYFTCVVAGATLFKLDRHPSSFLQSLKLFGSRFKHITKFAIVSIAFVPLGVIAQRKKLRSSPRGFLEVVGSSFSLSTAQLAPVILSEDKTIADTIRTALDTLGTAWKESLVIKSSTYITIIVLTVSIGFLPKLVESYWFDSSTAHLIGWLVSALLAVCLLITTKVLGTVFTATLYWQITKKKD